MRSTLRSRSGRFDRRRQFAFNSFQIDFYDISTYHNQSNRHCIPRHRYLVARLLVSAIFGTTRMKPNRSNSFVSKWPHKAVHMFTYVLVWKSYFFQSSRNSRRFLAFLLSTLSLSLSSLFLFPFLPGGKKGRPTPLTWIDPFEHNISKGITLRVSFQLLEETVSPFQKSLIALRYGLVSRPRSTGARFRNVNIFNPRTMRISIVQHADFELDQRSSKRESFRLL